MNATTTTNEARVAGFAGSTEQVASSEYLRFAQYSWLNEVPGVIFGLLTLVYIVSSLVALR